MAAECLGGGRPWRRRELGMLPMDFHERLPIGYLCYDNHTLKTQVHLLGATAPLLRLNDGRWHDVPGWLMGVSAEGRGGFLVDGVDAIALPESVKSETDRMMLLDIAGSADGVFWKIGELLSPALLAVYPSAMANKIDIYQEKWREWLMSALGVVSQDKVSEILVCVREALINADKHGCGNQPGRRIVLLLQKDPARKLLRAHVSDPGKGHHHNLNAAHSKLDQQMGRHLGLMLIHGLADRVRLSREGSTIEFDFSY